MGQRSTGGTCASDEPGEGTPKCVSRAKYDSMSKKKDYLQQEERKQQIQISNLKEVLQNQHMLQLTNLKRKRK